MKMMLVILSNEDVPEVTKQLIKEQYFMTKLSSTGGLLHNGNTTLLIGVEDEKVEKVKEIIGLYAKTRKRKIASSKPGDLDVYSYMPSNVKVNGATIFVLNVEDFYKL